VKDGSPSPRWSWPPSVWPGNVRGLD
jgi:hypothetical protein